ncbi:MAG: DUF2238 domain-containing protein [Planctomycetes bacterium]|nr:DUF2238 domain-containing protein [Planctomycetota bacterium]
MPYRAWLLVCLLLAIALSAIAPANRFDWALEHTPTAILLAWIVWYERRAHGSPLSNTAYTLLLAFLLLHVVGAHFLYSNVPYREWAEHVFGSVPSWLATERNHYDRVVHLCFGLFVLLPTAELTQRHVAKSNGWSVVVAIAFIGVFSKVYELLEWGIAVALSPEDAETYNGQQGDMFDAHKDMSLALLGSLLVAPWVRLRMSRTMAKETRAEPS